MLHPINLSWKWGSCHGHGKKLLWIISLDVQMCLPFFTLREMVDPKDYSIDEQISLLRWGFRWVIGEWYLLVVVIDLKVVFLTWKNLFSPFFYLLFLSLWKSCVSLRCSDWLKVVFFDMKGSFSPFFYLLFLSLWKFCASLRCFLFFLF